MNSTSTVGLKDNSRAVIEWFDHNERPLPWRHPDTSAWAILVSEVMSQQTPVSRVMPAWEQWMAMWPTPADLAQAPTHMVIKYWGKLGYPRRALRLKECATVIAEKYDNQVPSDVSLLLSLPGVGDYTARAVAAFAFQQPVPVVDINVRRVLYRAQNGTFITPPARRADLALFEELIPKENGARFSAAVMELGALVCTSTKPDCAQCPIVRSCMWQLRGCPEPSKQELLLKAKRVQKYKGTDRQVRGIILDALKESRCTRAEINSLWEDQSQLARALFSLLEDGLAVEDGEIFSLPH